MHITLSSIGLPQGVSLKEIVTSRIQKIDEYMDNSYVCTSMYNDCNDLFTLFTLLYYNKNTALSMNINTAQH